MGKQIASLKLSNKQPTFGLSSVNESALEAGHLLVPSFLSLYAMLS